MIHQLIFAHPKPGMSEQDFQDYWVNVHAVEYASKIPQIRRYLIDLRIPFGIEATNKDPLFSGVAEIWLKNEEEQIASLQSKEFLEGARRDEPNWAAFWRTVGLDTNAHLLFEEKSVSKNFHGIKILIMVKRKAGISLEQFRESMLDNHASKVMKIPGIRRYLQGHVRDSFYTIGESILDCVSQLWFDDMESLEIACSSPEYKELFIFNTDRLFESKYIHTMVVKEKWVIGPESR
ncbi:MAG: EthD domain-containing protein [Mastigocoleus sp. MO_167.B18]|uniref:EthD domain-containing protein n=1 Tax=Mastigocoleus sp. MO_188.B34 TaxID=3036635 RepID=UPI0026041F81|nr:EthD domain-containing protein [Mastigocoleus sp. MO_188.B34]MDJ0693714.1 EthD domain-containing protein [Mastigocoleus sp. MO_188.B34]MDJ0772976.1 EthD domain-containing protein [Mastigocoleus sp. MO_167.B18]